METEGAISLGLAILIFIYYAYIKKPGQKKTSTNYYNPNNKYDAEFANEQAKVVEKVLENIERKSPSDFWKGKTESEYNWLLKMHLSEHPGEYSRTVHRPEPSGVPDYFEYLKENKPNSFEYESGLKIAKGEAL